MTEDFRSRPVDAESEQRLAERGLRYALVDPGDTAAFDAWIDADARGFHSPGFTGEVRGWWRDGLAYRRTVGVYDDGPEPVGTTSSWTTEVTVPGGRAVPMWAISSVTVAPTHRRRGIARALLEGELRTAAALGLPVAGLTVSESTLYGRYGFAAAAYASDYEIDTRRAAWTGPLPDGRLGFIQLEEWERRSSEVHERARLQGSGDVPAWPLRWGQLSGRLDRDSARAPRMRAVRYTDADGVVQGTALYEVSGGDDDFTQHDVRLHFLVSATDDAYAALWRFVLELDLVTRVKVHLRRVDEPVRWMIADQRALEQTVWDHHWVRILDVPAALAARSYEHDGRLELEVDDELGFAGGRYVVDVVDGTATVTEGGEGTVRVTVQQLSAAYLGAVPPLTPELGLLRTARPPYLSIWY